VSTTETLDQQMNKFLVDLSNISKCFNTTNEDAARADPPPDTRLNLFQKRRTEGKHLDQIQQVEDAENNRIVITNIATRKYRRARSALPKGRDKGAEDEESNKTAVEVVDKLMGNTIHNFTCIKATDTVRNPKEMEKVLVNYLVEQGRDLESILSNKVATEDAEAFSTKSPYTFNYLKYLKKRRLILIMRLSSVKG
jgi:hypothetical protein